MMAGWDGRISDTEIWSIVNYLRALAANGDRRGRAVSRAASAGAAADAASWPTTSRCRSPPIPAARTRAAELARVNFLRDEPGGRRFFVNDLNGPLYILDKQTKAFTTYLDFNGLGGPAAACFSGSPSSATSPPA